MSYDIPYEPPQPMFTDTLLAFQAFAGPSVSARIAADPLGPVNKIVSLVVGQRVVKSVLCRVPVGASVRVVEERGGYGIRDMFTFRERAWDSRGTNEPEPPLPDYRPPGWYIEIDGEVALYASEAETARPVTVTIGSEPWRDRIRRYKRVAKRRNQAAIDRFAARLGYHRADDCTGWDE